MKTDPIWQCALTAAATVFLFILGGGVLAAVIQDERVLRTPVFLAVLSLGGGVGALLGVYRSWEVRDNATPGLLLCAGAIASAAWQIGFLHVPSDDYRLYELAARRWFGGASLYADLGHTNLPIVLLAVGGIRAVLQTILPSSFTDEVLWRLTYGVYEVSQLLAIIALIVALYALANHAGAARARAAIIAGVLVGFAFPVKESLVNNQINLVTLVLATSALVVAAQRPLIAGACAALGGVVKLYPFALLLEWLFARRWKALLSCVVATAAIVAVFWTHWADYAVYLRDVRMADAYRHAGLHAVVVNSSRSAVHALGGGESWRTVASAAWVVSIAIVAVWMAREASRVRHDDGERRGVELSARVMAAVLLVFPLAWTHHYVFAIPLVVCLWANEMPSMRVVIGTALMLFVPAFDVYPLGVHRLVGLTLVLVR